jgi:hypothetical protein
MKAMLLDFFSSILNGKLIGAKFLMGLLRGVDWELLIGVILINNDLFVPKSMEF